MKSPAKLNQNIILLAIYMAFTPALFSQADSLSKSGRSSVYHNESDEKIHSLYTGIGAGTNLIYLGSSISDNKPFYSAALTYGFRNALYASASATHLSQISPYLAFYNLALNYNHTFNSWFDISAGIAIYNTAESLHDSLFADFGYINLTAGFDWKLLYTKVSFAEVLSEENGFYLQISNSRYFETKEFLNGKSFVYFDPVINILMGKLIIIETANGTRKFGNAPPFSHPNKKTGKPSEYVSEKFGLMDFQFSLPVTFCYGKLSLEAEPSYLLSVYSYPLNNEPEGFTFYLNIIYKIF
jgi:hypothetical protein